MRNKRKGFSLIIVIIGLICLGIGSSVIFTSLKNKSSNLDNKNNIKPVGIKTLEYIKDYSNYDSFSVSTNTDIVFDDSYEWYVSLLANVNIKGKIIKIESYDGSSSNYVYYILNDKLHYYSFNGKTWKKNTNEEIELPDYSNIINKIKSNEEITNNGNNSYSLNHKYKLDSGEITTVPINVTFDDEGYLKQITYDLTKIDNSYKKYIKTRSFFDINSTKVIVPDNVINNSAQGYDVITLGF